MPVNYMGGPRCKLAQIRHKAEKESRDGPVPPSLFSSSQLHPPHTSVAHHPRPPEAAGPNSIDDEAEQKQGAQRYSSDREFPQTPAEEAQQASTKSSVSSVSAISPANDLHPQDGIPRQRERQRLRKALLDRNDWLGLESVKRQRRALFGRSKRHKGSAKAEQNRGRDMKQEGGGGETMDSLLLV